MRTAAGWSPPSGLDFIPQLNPWLAALLLGFAAQILFLIGLEHPHQMMFDETHYVPAARELFRGVAYGNVEHPLFGKWLIGLSMALFGDTPFGWRALSTVAGTATLIVLFGIAQCLFRDVRLSFATGLFALFNQLVFVQARIAMLDVYMALFLLLGLWLLIDAYPRRGWAVRLRLIGAGLMFGLALGCKWAVAPYLALAGVAYLALRIRSRRRGRLAWAGVSWIEGALWLGGVAAFSYLATFAPASVVALNRLAPEDILAQQLELYRLQTQPLADHPYESQWWEWPLMGRPVWYLYERVEGYMRGVLLIGNPAIMWGGLVAVAACAAGGLRRRDPRLLLIALLFVFAWGVWALIPKRIGFYYYYYLPALILPLALAAAFHLFCSRGRRRTIPPAFLALAVALFAYFYPILAARPLASDQAFKRWTWFDSWK